MKETKHTSEHIHKAAKTKNNEYYTRYSDIEREVSKYGEFFAGKTVYCNCDSFASNFFGYFVENFRKLGLKKLITSGFNPDGKGTFSETDISGTRKGELEGNGDYRSKELKKFVDECDVILTNPPYSGFSDYVDFLKKSGKEFLIVGPLMSVSYKSIFPAIRSGKIKIGYNHITKFIDKSGEIVFGGWSLWLTTLPVENKTPVKLSRMYSGNEENYPQYDNRPAIEVKNYKDIPADYPGKMGLSVSFFPKVSTEQFEIVSCSGLNEEACPITKNYDGWKVVGRDGKETDKSPESYNRVLLPGKKDGKEYIVSPDGKKLYSTFARIFLRLRNPIAA